jgi:hypothetical protein
MAVHIKRLDEMQNMTENELDALRRFAGVVSDAFGGRCTSSVNRAEHTVTYDFGSVAGNFDTLRDSFMNSVSMCVSEMNDIGLSVDTEDLWECIAVYADDADGGFICSVEIVPQRDGSNRFVRRVVVSMEYNECFGFNE